MTTSGGVTVSSQSVTIIKVVPVAHGGHQQPRGGRNGGRCRRCRRGAGTIGLRQQTFDFPQTIAALVVDGATVDLRVRHRLQDVLPADLDWPTGTAAPGPHSLVVTLTTTHGRVGSSPANVVS